MMRKFLPVLLWSVACCLPIQAQEETSNVAVGIVAEDSVVEWTGQHKLQLNLVFKNYGTTPVVLNYPQHRLILNGVFLPSADADLASKLREAKPLQPGEVRQISCDLAPYVARAGLYRVDLTPSLNFGHYTGFMVRSSVDEFSSEEQSTLELIRQIRSKLPSGWVANYSPDIRMVEVSRLGPSADFVAPPIPSSHPSLESNAAQAPKEAGSYEFNFRVHRYYSPTERQSLIQAGKKRIRDAEAFLRQARALGHISGKPGSYTGTEPSQEEPLRRYRELSRTSSPKIEYAFGKASLERWDFGGYSFRDEKIQRECKAVKEMVTGLLKPYASNDPN